MSRCEPVLLPGKVPDDVPRERCGFTTAYRSELSSSPDNVTCWREVWNDHNFCLWHANYPEKPADELIAARGDYPERFDGAILRGVEIVSEIEFQGCSFPLSDLSYSTLREINFSGVDFHDANISNADVSGSNLSGANLTNTNLENAVLQATNLEETIIFATNFRGANLGSASLDNALGAMADFRNADLWEASMLGSNIRGSDFKNASLARTDLTDTIFGGTDLTGAAISYNMLHSIHVNEGTTFGGKSQWEVWADQEAAESIPHIPWDLGFLRVFGRPYTYSDNIEQAELQYRATQRLHRENDLRQLAEFAIREKHARRKRKLAEREYWEWFQLAFYRWPLGYGEKVRNILVTSAVTIFGFALIFPFFGGMEATTGDTIKYAFLSSSGFNVPERIEVLWANLYFSTVTFTTLGYGDIQPGSVIVQGLASIESLLGALLMAYLVFVLGRRTTW